MEDKGTFDKMYEASAEYRSKIITFAVAVESSMEQVMTAHFTKHSVEDGFVLSDEYYKFHYCVFGNTKVLTFDNKREILRRILLTERYIEKSKDIKDLDTNLQKISETRNIIAHREVDFSEFKQRDFDGDSVSFFNLDRVGRIVRRVVFVLNEKKLKEEVDRSMSAIKTLKEILYKIHPDAKA